MKVDLKMQRTNKDSDILGQIKSIHYFPRT